MFAVCSFCKERLHKTSILPIKLLPVSDGGEILTTGGCYTTVIFETDALNHSVTPPTSGEGGIRTPGGCYTPTVFKTATINHSVTSPNSGLMHVSITTIISSRSHLPSQLLCPHFRQENLCLLLVSSETGFKIERRAVESNHKVLPSHDLAGRFLPGRIYSPINSLIF